MDADDFDRDPIVTALADVAHRDPVVHAWLSRWRYGHCTRDECLVGCIRGLADERALLRAELLRAAELGPAPVFVLPRDRERE